MLSLTEPQHEGSDVEAVLDRCIRSCDENVFEEWIIPVQIRSVIPSLDQFYGGR